MDSLPPIPTPPAQRWREFRIQVLPVIIFLITVGAIFHLWRTYVLPSNLVGMVETNTVYITCSQAGLLTDLSVEPFSEVTNGQPIAVVAPYSDELVRSAVERVAADQNVMRERMTLNELGKLEAVTKLGLDLFDQQTLLEVAKVKLNETELALDRKNKLYKDGIVPEADLEIAQAARDTYKSEVLYRTKLVQAWEQALTTITPQQTNISGQVDSAIDEAIRKGQDEVRALYKPIVLRAPIDGKVSVLFYRAGQQVNRGEPILAITGAHSERILAFVRQPITVYPREGDIVTVRTRSMRRQSVDAQIVRVGSQLEPISPFLLPWSATRRASELGLPIAVAMPRDLRLMPGETVELAIKR